MRKTICPHCGKTMYDPEYSERHRCQFCKEFLNGYEERLHEELSEVFQSKNETTIPVSTDDGNLCCDACGCRIDPGQTQCEGCGRTIEWDK